VADQLLELCVGYIRLVHVETIHIDTVNGSSVKSGFHAYVGHIGRIVCSHREFSTGDPDHSVWRSSGSGLGILNR